MIICGLDIGGTNLKVAFYDEMLRELRTKTVPSQAKSGAEVLLSNIFSLLDGEVFDALGVSTAGMVGSDGSILYANDNIPRYTGTPLQVLLTGRYHVPVRVLGDIFAAALAENEIGGDDYYYLSLGTGVGGIHVLNGEPRPGNSRIAGQIGYLPSWNARGIIDKEASVSGLERRSGCDGKAVFDLAKAGDVDAAQALDRFGTEVAYTIGLIQGFIDPKVIVIGGAISCEGDRLLECICAHFDVIPEPYRKGLSLVTASGGQNSGTRGAAGYIRRFL